MLRDQKNTLGVRNATKNQNNAMKNCSKNAF